MFKNIFLIFLFVFLASNTFALSLNEINNSLQKTNASWKVGPSQVWYYPFQVKKQMMGMNDLVNKDFSFSVETSIKSIPDRIDWRNKNGINYMSPVTNQGRCGSCVAFAAVGTFEAQMNIANNWPNLNMNFSEAQLFSCGGGGCNRGWRNSSASSRLRNRGVTDEACLPYTSGANGKDQSCSDACSNSSERSYKIRRAESVGGWYPNENDLIDALKLGPVLSRMSVYEDFIAYKSGIYRHTTGGYLGGHAVVIVGYDKNERYWIVKNSWGTDWGEDGYFNIQFGDSSNMTGEFTLEVDPIGGGATITSPTDREVISGTYYVNIDTNVQEANDVVLELRRDGADDTYTFRAQRAKDISRYSVSLKTFVLQDGVYEGRIIVSSKGLQTYKSRYKRFFIINNIPTMEVLITSPLEGASLSDKVVVKFLLNGTPLPVMKMDFIIKNSKSEIVKTVTNINPAAETHMSWRTKNMPNGEYEIHATGYIGQYKVEGKHIKVQIMN